MTRWARIRTAGRLSRRGETGRRLPRSVRTIGLLACAGSLALAACVDSFLEPEPATDPVALFDQLWGEFDRHYAFFVVKDLDWDALRARYRPEVHSGTTDAELLDVFSRMLDHLEDGHVNVFTPQGGYGYSAWRERSPANFEASVAFSYLDGGRRRLGGGRLTYGLLEAELGYLHVSGFDPGEWIEDVDEALGEMDGIRGLVLDLRDNGGGTDLTLEELVGRFLDRRRLYRHFRYRNGPGHDDFTELRADHVEPRGSERFLGPVALLTNRSNYSTAEDFILAMRARGAVVTVGDTTGGGAGNPIMRELANGWTYRLSRWQLFDADRRPFPEGVGLAPDVPVMLDPTEPERDEILERGIAALRERIDAEIR